MYIIKNALKNLARNKGRNLLIGIIVLSMISTIAISITINTTTNEVIDSYKSRFGSEVTIGPDIEKLNKKIEEGNGDLEFIESITAKQNINFSKSEYLKESKMLLMFLGDGVDIKGVGQEEYEKQFGENNKKLGNLGSDIALSSKEASLSIEAYTENNMPEQFGKGFIEIKAGEMYKNKGEAIISEELAKVNKLNVGDEIKIKDSFNQGKILNLKISGIYKDLRKPKTEDTPSQDNRNVIYTSIETLSEYEELFDAKDSSIMGVATFFLKSPNLLEDFTKELRNKGLSDDYEVSTDKATYNRVVGPVNGLKKVSTMFMIGIMIFGSIVLILLSVLSIRERKYEIGVLRAMGMSKFNLAKGFIFESISIIAICLTLGLGIGSVAAQPVSDILLKEQVAAVKEGNSQAGQMFMTSDESSNESVKALEELDVKLTPNAAIQVAGFALVLGLITSTISVTYATKYEPIKILQERN